MKKLAFVLLFIPVFAMSMTRYADGSIMLTPQEVANVERNFAEMKATLEQAAEVIEMQEKKIDELAKGGKCI
jgi:hypothetical protein